MSEKARLSWTYWAGIVTAYCVISLHQDILGQEAYLHWIQEHWVSWKITVPIAVVLLVVVFFVAGWCRAQAGGGNDETE